MQQSPSFEVSFEVSGMSCAHCENAIQAELAGIEGLTVLDISASQGLLRVGRSSQIDESAISAIISAVDEAGYEATLTRPES